MRSPLKGPGVTPDRTLRPIWPGLEGPLRHHPGCAPTSLRRTTSIDISVAEDLSKLSVQGRGRDLLTDEAGEGHILDTAEIEAELTLDERRVVRLEATESGRPLDVTRLVGSRAGSGFRRALREEFPMMAESGGLLALLLDEVPVASVISGMAVVRTRARLGLTESIPQRPKGKAAPLDVCVGWKTGSLMSQARLGEGTFDFGAQGPITPPPETDSPDPLAWHHTGPIAEGQVRRRRRLDLWRPSPAGPISIDVWFRDAFGEAPGVESGVHEYDVAATVDPDSLVVLGLSARPRVLPAPECPQAAASAERLEGKRLSEVRDLVRASFTGPSTCTHLNDTLRAMGDLFAAIPLITDTNDHSKRSRQ